MVRKRVYPYEYMDSRQKFKEAEPPHKEQFYSNFDMEHITNSYNKHIESMERNIKR